MVCDWHKFALKWARAVSGGLWGCCPLLAEYDGLCYSAITEVNHTFLKSFPFTCTLHQQNDNQIKYAILMKPAQELSWE